MTEIEKLKDEVKQWQHIANEWADVATNGVQCLRNVRDNISEFDESIDYLLKSFEEIRKLECKLREDNCTDHAVPLPYDFIRDEIEKPEDILGHFAPGNYTPTQAETKCLIKCTIESVIRWYQIDAERKLDESLRKARSWPAVFAQQSKPFGFRGCNTKENS